MWYKMVSDMQVWGALWWATGVRHASGWCTGRRERSSGSFVSVIPAGIPYGSVLKGGLTTPRSGCFCQTGLRQICSRVMDSHMFGLAYHMHFLYQSCSNSCLTTTTASVSQQWGHCVIRIAMFCRIQGLNGASRDIRNANESPSMRM